MKRPFTIRRSAAGADRITLREAVGVAAAGELHQSLIEISARCKDLQIDCAECDYLDTAILQLLVAGQADWYQRGHAFELIDVSPDLESQLLRTGLGAHFECVTSSRSQSRRAVSASQAELAGTR